ncbi:MAG TPA: hypothetical protein VKZ59_04045 [Acidobacteriota bacterium]|nr:hypothetical protein [Acidobacteriota bacterium]
MKSWRIGMASGDKRIIFISEDSIVEELLIGVLTLKKIPFRRAASEPEAIRRLVRHGRVVLVDGLQHLDWINRLKRLNPDVLAIGLCTEQGLSTFVAADLDYCLRPFDFDFLLHLLKKVQVSQV